MLIIFIWKSISHFIVANFYDNQKWKFSWLKKSDVKWAKERANSCKMKAANITYLERFNFIFLQKSLILLR